MFRVPSKGSLIRVKGFHTGVYGLLSRVQRAKVLGFGM